tara:strand:+ start:15461 stop:15709 length:249 start_codon:yes stop_codon:yes gene_type:complete
LHNNEISYPTIHPMPSMGLGRALVFASVMILPAMVVGLASWLAFGGSETWQSWQYATCYAIPGALVVSSFIIGYMGSGENDR